MTYCFKCPRCGATCQTTEHQPYGLWCAVCLIGDDEYVVMLRDWRAEAANVNVAGLH